MGVKRGKIAGADNLAALMAREEPLCEELAVRVEDAAPFKMLRHPLVYAVPYISQLNALYNAQFRHKKEACSDAVRKEDFERYVLLHERPHRVRALSCIACMIPEHRYWQTVAWAWTDSENIWQNIEKWRELLTCDIPGRGFMMTKAERVVLKALPEKVRVFRGCTELNEKGLSWTLTEAKAKWFAGRFGKGGKVVGMFVDKRDIVAYLDGRNEQEVIVL